MGISQTADDATTTSRRILSLKTQIETERLPNMGKRTPLARRFLELLYQTPVVSAQQVALALAITPSTANRLIARFSELGILREKTGFRRNRLFEFGEYLGLFE